MKTNLTKQEMVKDIFFAATDGKRNTSNFVKGMWLIETIAKNNYKRTIETSWTELTEATVDTYRRVARHLLYKLVDCTWNNTWGVNGPTETSREVKSAYRMFI